MAEKKNGGPPEKPHLQEDAIVARLKSESTPAHVGLTSFTGLLGRSTKPGRWLLYPSLDMSLSVEIAEEDIVHSERLPAEQSPFGTLGGTRIFVKKGAEVTTTRTVSHTQAAGAAGDEFDLDIRLGGGAGGTPLVLGTRVGGFVGGGGTCETCRGMNSCNILGCGGGGVTSLTCPQDTCNCPTQGPCLSMRISCHVLNC
jgi:hypothetical protein